MSWIGLRHKGFEVLLPEEWNTVVDALDILYAYIGQCVKYDDLARIKSDLIPAEDAKYCLGSPERAWLAIYTHNVVTLSSSSSSDPPPDGIETYALSVERSPIPLSEVSRLVRRIHIKLPSWSKYLLYIGNERSQEFILEPGEKQALENQDPSRVYVRSLGNVTIHVMLED